MSLKEAIQDQIIEVEEEISDVSNSRKLGEIETESYLDHLYEKLEGLRLNLDLETRREEKMLSSYQLKIRYKEYLLKAEANEDEEIMSYEEFEAGYITEVVDKQI